ncbi:MAG: hypothetical protein QM737_01585 [Ferruginibacter sp.]
MKRFLKNLFFPDRNKQRILSGPSKGMFVKYDINHRSQHLLGLYEREIYAYLAKGIKKSDVLVDVGANDGYYVLAFLRSGKKVIACEPGPIITELVENAGLNNYTESKDFIIERRLVGSGGAPDFVSVEKLVQAYSGNKFFLVDIDGGEFDLLNSCGNNYDHKHSTWLVETHSKELEDNCVDLLKKWNYKVTIIKNAWWRKFIPEHRGVEHNRWLYAEPV